MEIYKAFRPKLFKHVIGQDEAVNAMLALLKEKRFPQSTLIAGPSGCGKTTIARILQKKLGCVDMDFREINGAANRGIDDIRKIQERLDLAPHGESRVYMIDECHKVSNDGQTALLKSLEDTPPRIFFILCTTDPEKIIPTIRNRCTRFNLRSLEDEEIQEVLSSAAERAKIDLPSEEVVQKIISHAKGSARRALVLLDQVRSLPSEQEQLDSITPEEEEERAIDLCKLLLANAKWGEIAKVLKETKGDAEQIRRLMLAYMRSVLLNSVGTKEGKMKGKSTPYGVRAFYIMQCFQESFFYTGAPGLAMACYEASLTAK